MKSLLVISMFLALVSNATAVTPSAKTVSLATTTKLFESTSTTSLQSSALIELFSLYIQRNFQIFVAYTKIMGMDFGTTSKPYLEKAKDFISIKLMGGEHFKFSEPLEQIVNEKKCSIRGTGSDSTLKCSSTK